MYEESFLNLVKLLRPDIRAYVRDNKKTYEHPSFTTSIRDYLRSEKYPNIPIMCRKNLGFIVDRWFDIEQPNHSFLAQGVISFLIAFELANREFIHIKIHKTGSTSLNKILGVPFPHLCTPTIKAILTPEEWESAKKVCMVRNTYERIASWFLDISHLRNARISVYADPDTRLELLLEEKVEFFQYFGMRYEIKEEDNYLEINTVQSTVQDCFHNWISMGCPEFSPTLNSNCGVRDQNAEPMYPTSIIPHLPASHLNQMNWIRDVIGEEKGRYFIGDFKHYDRDIIRLCEFLNIESLNTIPHLNVANRRKEGDSQRNYRALYSDRSVDIISDLFKEEIDYFGFKFNEA